VPSSLRASRLAGVLCSVDRRLGFVADVRRKAAILSAGLLLLYPGYGILFHGLAGDALFAAAFAGWAVVLARAILRPSVTTFVVAGAGMGLLVLVRPSNQVLIVVALVPLLLRAPWGLRLKWVASFFDASAAVTQGRKLLATLLYGDGVAPAEPRCPRGSRRLALFFTPAWRRRLALLAIPLVVAVVAVGGVSLQNPAHYVLTLSQIPSGNHFLFRVFEISPIISPDNGPESRELARIVERDLLTKEPYRSYGVDVDEFFSSGSDRMFSDLNNAAVGVDLSAVTQEAIRRHPGTFATGIARTIWDMTWAGRVYAPEGAVGGSAGGSTGEGEAAFVVIDGRRLPRPSDGDLIPSAHFGQAIRTTDGQAREVWRSPTEHPVVFDDPRDESRWVRFERDTERLVDRIPTRSANQYLVHRLNQASHRYPPLALWLVVGLVALAIRRPRRALVALAPSLAALVVILATSLVAFGVAEYAAPVGRVHRARAAGPARTAGARVFRGVRRRCPRPGQDATTTSPKQRARVDDNACRTRPRASRLTVLVLNAEEAGEAEQQRAPERRE
jgi:hypothetical protein